MGANVNEQGVKKFLKSQGFKFMRKGKGSHSLWKHNITGRVATVPQAKHMGHGTWKAIQKLAREQTAQAQRLEKSDSKKTVPVKNNKTTAKGGALVA